MAVWREWVQRRDSRIQRLDVKQTLGFTVVDGHVIQIVRSIGQIKHTFAKLE